jgi:hypothetical protein
MKLKFLISLFLLSTVTNSQIIKSVGKVNFDIDSYKSHLEYLGSDSLEGRGTGTRGGKLAAEYIARKFAEIGLEPALNGSYYQNIPLHGIINKKKSKLYLSSEYETKHLVLRDDYLIINSGEQTLIPKFTELIFVGYGIIAPEYDYNDYLFKDVEGKIAVMLDGEPYSEDKEYFMGPSPTIFSTYDAKHRIALSKGAYGTIIIPFYKYYSNDEWIKLGNEYQFEDVKTAFSPAERFSILLNSNNVQKIFSTNLIPSDNILDYFETIFSEEYSIQFEGEFINRDFTADNVIGLLPARVENSLDEYVILSAHYDHLGIGPEQRGDTIYNGVLDNAMGVSALIELAKELTIIQPDLSRSILFIAVAAEEKGLQGSEFYTQHPVVPLYKTVANINIDGVAYLDEFNSIVPLGAELSNLFLIIDGIADKLKLSTRDIPPRFYSLEAFSKSDQLSFAKAGIPSVLIIDALDYKHINREEALSHIVSYHNNVYHTPFDDLSIPINYSAVNQHLQVIYEVTKYISVNNIEVFWKEDSPFFNSRLQTIAEKR